MITTFLLRSLKEGDHAEGLGVDGRYGNRVGLRIGTGGGLL
jgi:hypothetical protein